jgi:protein-histidine pros-kinase
MIRRYGTANGFGWKLDEIVGAQIVSVPMAFPERRADRALRGFIGAFAAIFLAAFALLNAMLTVLVVRPVTRLAKAADEVSLGKIDAPEFPASGRDEVSMLAQSFNRMKKSLAHAIKLLEQ